MIFSALECKLMYHLVVAATVSPAPPPGGLYPAMDPGHGVLYPPADPSPGHGPAPIGFEMTREYECGLEVLVYRNMALGCYSTFQYLDQDAYQDMYSEDFNADALFHVSVSVKRICLYLPYYKQCLHNIVISHMKMQYLLSKMW